MISDYTTSDNVTLTKGQHIQIIQRLNNDFSIVQLLDHLNGSNSKHYIEVEIPNSIIKSKHKLDENQNSEEDPNKAAAKRKGSFKKWLRSSHRKFTSQTASIKVSHNKLSNSDIDNLKIKKVLSNSEDLKIKNWMIEETNHEEDENYDNEQDEQVISYDISI